MILSSGTIPPNRCEWKNICQMSTIWELVPSFMNATHRLLLFIQCLLLICLRPRVLKSQTYNTQMSQIYRRLGHVCQRKRDKSVIIYVTTCGIIIDYYFGKDL